MSDRQPKLSLETNRLMTSSAPPSPPVSVPNSASVLESGLLGTGRRFSFTQKLLGTSKDLLSSFYGMNEKEDGQVGGPSPLIGSLGSSSEVGEEYNHLMLMNERRRTSSISSDISTDDQPMERKNSISERLIAMQVGTFFS
jgi:hypothetical protein